MHVTILQRIESEVLKLTAADAAGFTQVEDGLATAASGIAAVDTRLAAIEERLASLEAAAQAINETVQAILAVLNQQGQEPVVGIDVEPGAPTAQP